MTSGLVTRRYACKECPLRKLPAFRPFDGDELAFVDTFKQGELSVEAGSPIVLEAANSPHLYTVLKGWGFRYKTLSDGRRQILNYLLPGDLIGLQTSVFEVMEHGVEALSDMLLCVFARDRAWDIYTSQPSLAYDVTWLAARQERFLDDHLLTVGRRTALERVAYVVWALYRRARSLDMVNGNALDIPLTQQHLADTLGLSLVHTNKTLRRLRDSGCIDWAERILTVNDEDSLRGIAKAEDAEEKPRPFI